MPKHQPHVLFLPKWYPNRLDAFDGNFIENHAKAIAKFSKIGILFVHSDELSKGKFEVLQSNTFGYPEIRVYFKKSKFAFGLGRLVNAYRYLKAQQMGYALYKKEYSEPELIHIHVLTRPFVLAYLLYITKGIPYLISEHWSGYFKESGAYKGWIKKMLSQLAVSNAKAVSCVSEYLANAMKAHGLKSEYHIIPNVVAIDVFRPREKKVSETKMIIHVSTLDIVPKNLPRLFQLMEKMLGYRKDFTLDIYGDGDDRQKLEKQVEKLKIGEHVKFHGNVSQEEVAKAMSQSDFLVLFSLYENQPCVILEAMSSGLAVIAPKTGGIPEHLRKEFGTMVEVENIGELEQAMNQMLDKSREYDAQAVRTYALDHFSEDLIGRKFLDLYHSILLNS